MFFIIFISTLSIFTPEVRAMTTLNITVFDESGFPPASIHGVNRLENVSVKIYTLDDTLVISGLTDSSGTVSFDLAEGSYRISYGGGRLGVSSKIVDVSGSSVSVDLYCFTIMYHIYDSGKGVGDTYELNYIDLDRDSSGYQDTVIVQPGQQVKAEFSWWELETANWPVWYVSVFGEWAPTSAIGNLGSGVASPSSHNLYTVPITFTAPTTSGVYEVRLVGVEDYDWPNSYYTNRHYQPTLGRDTAIWVISKTGDGSYGIGTIIVFVPAPPQPVGGYSVIIEGYATGKILSPYLALIAILAIGFTAFRCKISRKRK
jgi:hypothetical protein